MYIFIYLFRISISIWNIFHSNFYSAYLTFRVFPTFHILRPFPYIQNQTINFPKFISHILHSKT